MKISAKTEYACIAVMDLAEQQESGEPVRIRKIAERHHVPPRFLVQILLQLKAAGIVSSTRGAAGGYHLLPKPKELTLGEVMAIVDGSNQPTGRTSSAHKDSPAVKVLTHAWETAEKKRQDYLGNITIADLVKKAKKEGSQSYSI
jgi:Rrf2 family protein